MEYLGLQFSVIKKKKVWQQVPTLFPRLSPAGLADPPVFSELEHLCWRFGFFCLHSQLWRFLYGMNGSLYKHQWLEVYLGGWKLSKESLVCGLCQQSPVLAAQRFRERWSSFGFILQRIPNPSHASNPLCVSKQVVSAGGNNHLFSAAWVV